MDISITMFSKPLCVQCDGTYSGLNRRGFREGDDYQVIDLSQNPTAMEFVKNVLGLMSAPAVLVHAGDWKDFKVTDETQNDFWAGFRPDRIAGIRELQEAMVA